MGQWRHLDHARLPDSGFPASGLPAIVRETALVSESKPRHSDGSLYHQLAACYLESH
ncbi:hypothetical protein CBM2585_A50044 [Cupriavidus taiwanensis]|nr:hypothetical protein CBM2585_A50044 [Cupriavidus taiwanensis]